MTNRTPSLTDLQDESNWLEFRSLIPEPFHATDMVTTDQTRFEFLHGAAMLRLDKRPPRAGDGGVGVTPIQLAVADVINAGKPLVGILEPRRTTKTTSIQAVMIGRCAMRDDYVIGWTMATTGAKAGERFRKDIVVHMLREFPTKPRPFDVNVGKGTEHISWPNGSSLNVYAPNGDGFRSGGFDLAFVDEGGEADQDLSEDLTKAIMPTMDTKFGAQFVIAGTGAKFRDGNLLWDTLSDPDAGIMRHSFPDNLEPEELAAWEASEENPRARVRELIELYHPGVGWTTPIDAVKRAYEKFPTAFLMEYGGIFGTEGASATIIPPAQWERAAVAGTAQPPAKFSLAIAVHPDGLWSSIGVAFHYEGATDLVSDAFKLDGVTEETNDRRAIGLLHHQTGTQGFADKVLEYARKYRVPVVYDQLSQAVGVEVETLQRAMPRPELQPATTADVRRGATKFLKELEAGTLVHFRQHKPLQDAAAIAIKRQIGSAGGFGFGRPKDDFAADITPLEACSLALHFLPEVAPVLVPASIIEFD